MPIGGAAVEARRDGEMSSTAYPWRIPMRVQLVQRLPEWTGVAAGMDFERRRSMQMRASGSRDAWSPSASIPEVLAVVLSRRTQRGVRQDPFELLQDADRLIASLAASSRAQATMEDPVGVSLPVPLLRTPGASLRSPELIMALGRGSDWYQD